MHPVTTLVCFGIRQVIGVDVQDLAQVVEQRFSDHSTTLPRALANANDKAWKALGVALAGNGLMDKVKINFLSTGDEKAFREQVNRFLIGKGVAFEGSTEEFRAACLTELNQARKTKFLSAEDLAPKEIARQTAQDYRRYTDPHALVEDAEKAIVNIAKALGAQCPQLAQLITRSVAGGPPLLVAAFGYFFRREVETNQELARGLLFDGLRQLSVNQEAAFKEVGSALDSLGERFAEVMDILESINARLQRLEEQIQKLLDLAGMRSGEVRPQYSFCIRNDEEKRAVKQLLERYRELPENVRATVPALLNDLGKLQVGTGEFAGASEAFVQVAKTATDPADQAEAWYNAYLAALEQKKWDEALVAIKQAADLAPERFAPFPLDKYPPQRILGAGGFGTAFLCQHAYFHNKEVVVKALHAADLDRPIKEVFAEAQALHDLRHSAIIGVQDCSYADRGHSRPYIVMDYFPGASLEQFVQQRGTLSSDQLRVVARQIAEGMREAHAHGILHRDLKPDNVLVRHEGDTWQVKIIDFGLAIRREMGEADGDNSSAKSIIGQSVAGTLKYAPPEQLGEMPGIKPGTFSDVYAFGKLCCYALFRTTMPLPSHWKSLPSEFAQMLEGCLHEGLEQRLKNFDQVLKALSGGGPTVRKVPCPQCQAILKVAADFPSGKKIKCPKCGAIFSVPGPTLPPPPFEKDMKDALEEWRTKGSPQSYFQRQGPARVGDWRAGAQKGDAMAQWLLSRSLQEGAGVPKDAQAALSWLRKAAVQRLPVAQTDLGDCYYLGEGVDQDGAEAFRLYSKAAEQEFAEAQRNCGDCYYEGEGVRADFAEAVKWYRKAVEQHWSSAMIDLAQCYGSGDGVEEDAVEAVRWYRSAAELGNPEGQNSLGVCYFDGCGVEQDFPQAIGWYRKAAEQGVAWAQRNLGYCYESGKGVKKNREEAAKWYLRAAEQGLDEGQFEIGYCYEHGHGVQKDLVQAERWYRKAVEQGHRKAKNALKKRFGSEEEQQEKEPDEGDNSRTDLTQERTFNTLLREAGFDPCDVRLIRHADPHAETSPYEMWLHDRKKFEDYQSGQSVRNRPKFNAPFWAVFLGTPEGETMFVGIYGVKYRGLLEPDDSCDGYELTLRPELSERVGKLFIDWGPGKLAWVQYADRQEKPIVELGSEDAGMKPG